jgi:hypothetical protein
MGSNITAAITEAAGFSMGFLDAIGVNPRSESHHVCTRWNGTFLPLHYDE